MLKIKLPLRKSRNPNYKYPPKHLGTDFYPYMYIGDTSQMRFVHPDTGIEICIVPGVICPRS